MSKKITDIRINKEMQSIEKDPIPSVLVKRDGHLAFHFLFYDLEEQYKQGFYHGLLELPEDYPFSPPKIRFLTNNGRFEVGKSICTTFTHYHKQTWSSSWNIRSILTAMISFMYCDEKGIGGIFEPPEVRRLLAARSLQQNLRNQKFVQLFKETLIDKQIVSAETIDHLLARIEKIKRRKRERSETTHADEVRDIPQIMLKVEVNQQKPSEGERDSRVQVIYMAEQCQGRKRGMGERDQVFADEIAQMEIFEKKIKIDQLDSEREEVGTLWRQKTVQDNQNI